MRIDVNNPTASLLSADWSQSQAAKKVSGGAAEKAAEDRTSLSPVGSMVQALTMQAMRMPEVRQDRVEALRQAVAAGTYPLHAAGIAAAIVSSGEE